MTRVKGQNSIIIDEILDIHTCQLLMKSLQTRISKPSIHETTAQPSKRIQVLLEILYSMVDVCKRYYRRQDIIY